MTKVHAAIRANPDRKKKAGKVNPDRAHRKFRLRKLNA